MLNRDLSDALREWHGKWWEEKRSPCCPSFQIGGMTAVLHDPTLSTSSSSVLRDHGHTARGIGGSAADLSILSLLSILSILSILSFLSIALESEEECEEVRE